MDGSWLQTVSDQVALTLSETGKTIHALHLDLNSCKVCCFAPLLALNTRLLYGHRIGRVLGLASTKIGSVCVCVYVKVHVCVYAYGWGGDGVDNKSK